MIGIQWRRTGRGYRRWAPHPPALRRVLVRGGMWTGRAGRRWPTDVTLAFDIGTDTGVLAAALLAGRGVRARPHRPRPARLELCAWSPGPRNSKARSDLSGLRSFPPAEHRGCGNHRGCQRLTLDRIRRLQSGRPHAAWLPGPAWRTT
jgi:hypothetical protein